MSLTVLLSAPPTSSVDDLCEVLAGAGFAVRGHSLGSAPGVEFATLTVAVVDVSDRPDTASAQTRRWRAELGDELLPIVWLLPTADAMLAARGLDSGADAVLARPLDPGVFLAQMRAAVRVRGAAARVAARAAEARLLGERLNRAFAQSDRELEVTRRVRLALLPRSFPELGSVRFAICHRPRDRIGGDFYAIHELDSRRVLFLVGDVIEPSATGGFLGKFATEAVLDEARSGEAVSAGALLAAANRELLRLALDDTPLVALLVGVLNIDAGELALARAGLPAPVLIPATGEPETWAVPGPFLGVTETTYPTHTATLRPGDKLLIGTDGTRPAGDPGPGDDTRLLESAARHRDLSGQRFVDAVATDLLAHVQHDDDFTLLCVGMDATGS